MTLETSFEMFELFADPELDQDALVPSGQWPGDRQFDHKSTGDPRASGNEDAFENLRAPENTRQQKRNDPAISK
jgi:hypothetical protein